MMDRRLEELCEVMHDAYEKAAVGAGWQTQPASRKPWADVPEANKVTMRAAVSALVDHLYLSVDERAGLTVSPDGSLLNWQGVNYVRQSPPPDWAAYAQDYLSDDPGRLQSHLPPEMREG